MSQSVDHPVAAGEGFDIGYPSEDDYRPEFTRSADAVAGDGPRDIGLVFIGDAFIAGYGDPKGLGWVSRVVGRSSHPDVDLTAYNLGIRGDSSADVLNRWRAEGIPRWGDRRERRLVIGVGQADAEQRLTTARSRLNLANILDDTTARGIAAFVVGPPPTLDPDLNSRLEIIVLLEEDDVETIEAAKRTSPPEFVRLLVVPDGQPRTKPRACNYGLAFARGQYVVIYDAEDRPAPDQLRKAMAAFERDRFEREVLGRDQPPLAVVQASLSYFNSDYNVLTRMFAVEYAHWFESMLPGLEGTGIPVPLGGTSNHFETQVLRELGAWDPYNVTEDADLGLRAAVDGYRVTVIDSTTGEEACARTSAWIRQRTRWIKGYLITSAVNLRHPVRFTRRVGLPGVIGMIGLILGTPMAFLLYPIVTTFTVITFVGSRSFGLEIPTWLMIGSAVSMLFGNGLMIATAAIAATRRYSWRIGVFAVFSPLYWFLHAYAAWRALYQTLVDPHRWEKTPHGISEGYVSAEQ